MKESIIESIRYEAFDVIPELSQLLLSNIELSKIMFFKVRVKSEESYLLRMKRLNLNLGEVNDLIGFCLVLNSEVDCYNVLQEITAINELEILEIKDYIIKPCGINQYQAIHISFKFRNVLGEIQLKTKGMYDHAENTYQIYKNSLPI